MALFDKHLRPHEDIRRLGVTFEDLVNKEAVPRQGNLFAPTKDQEGQKEEDIQKTLLSIKGRFGKNAILRASSLEEDGTIRYRNTLVGGHNGE